MQVEGKNTSQIRGAFDHKHKPFATSLLEKSGVNPAVKRAYEASVIKLIERELNCNYVGGQFLCKWEAIHVSYEFEIGSLLEIVLGGGDTGSSGQETPAPIDEFLPPPFPYSQEEYGGAPSYEPRQNVTDASYHVSARAVVAPIPASNLSGLGHFYLVPDGYQNATFSATLPDTEFDMMAFAVGIGVSWASASSTIDVLSENNIACIEHSDHGIVIAPLIWYAANSGKHTVIIDCDFDPPAQNDEIVMSFYSRANAFALVHAATEAETTGHPRDLRIRLSQ